MLGPSLPTWLPVALFLVAAGLSLICYNQISLLRLPESRWTIAAILGSTFAALMAPSPWIAAFLLSLALSIPVSLFLLTSRRITDAGYPVAGAAGLLAVAVWVVALGMVSQSIRDLGAVVLVAVALVSLATFNNLFGLVQVLRGIPYVRWNEAYCGGQVGQVVRAPTALLHNSWKPAAINAVVLPLAIGLSLQGGLWWLVALPVALMLWQMREAQGVTCPAGAAVGALAVLIVSGLALPALVLMPLGLVAYPAARRKVREDPRWEAWAILWRRIRACRGLGYGFGAWAALAPETPKEKGRRWYVAHNDWLETLHDCGPLPVLFAAGYLVSASIQVFGGAPPVTAGLYGSLIALAVVSCGYMPWRAWPVNLFGIGIVACWQAL